MPSSQNPYFDERSMETATDIKGDEKAVFIKLRTPFDNKQQERVQ